MSLGI
jgi:hypothetical protein